MGMGTLKQKKKIFCIVITAAVFVAAEIFFFRNIIFQGAFFGDRGDGRLTMLLAEHWWNVFRGKEPFFELRMFYPAENVIGYTDMMLGLGVLHSLFRGLGMDMYGAYRLALISVHVLGTAVLFLVLKKKFRLETGWSMVGVVSFSYSNVYAMLLGHTQLMMLSFVPLLVLFLINIVETFSRKRRQCNIWAIFFIASFVLTMYTSWYIAFFTALFLLLFGKVFLIRGICGQRQILIEALRRMRGRWVDIICWIFLAALLMIPFLRVYLPVMMQTSGYDWLETAAFLPEAADLINVGTNNLAEGWLMELLDLDARGYVGEIKQGYPLVFWFLFLILFLWLTDSEKKENARRRFWIQCLGISCIIGVSLTLRLSANGLSLWRFVYEIIPGAKSIRTVCRFLMYLTLPFSMYAAIAGQEMSRCFLKKRDFSGNQKGRRRAIRIRSAIVYLTAGLLFVFNINTEAVYSMNTVSAGRDLIENVSEPPADCEVFYIRDSSGNQGGEEWMFACCIAQLDAVEIANRYGIKTINGYSGQFPPGWGQWDGIYDIYSDSYEEYVRQWILEYDLENVYVYDRGTNAWSKS